MLDAQAAYYDSQRKYYKVAYTIENIKLSKGYALQSDVDLLKSQYDLADAQYYGIQDSITILRAKLEADTGIQNVRPELDIPIKAKTYSLESLNYMYLNRNSDISLLQSYADAYKLYSFEISGTADVSDLEIQQVDMTIENYQDQIVKARSDTKIYSIQAYYTYQSTFRNMLAYKKYMDALKTKYDSIYKKYKAGKSTELEADEAFMYYMEAVYNYYSQVKSVITYQYILDNGVYGFS